MSKKIKSEKLKVHYKDNAEYLELITLLKENGELLSALAITLPQVNAYNAYGHLEEILDVCDILHDKTLKIVADLHGDDPTGGPF